MKDEDYEHVFEGNNDSSGSDKVPAEYNQNDLEIRGSLITSNKRKNKA